MEGQPSPFPAQFERFHSNGNGGPGVSYDYNCESSFSVTQLICLEIAIASNRDNRDELLLHQSSLNSAG